MDIGKPLREVDVVPQEVPMTPTAPAEPIPQQVPEEVPVGGMFALILAENLRSDERHG